MAIANISKIVFTPVGYTNVSLTWETDIPDRGSLSTWLRDDNTGLYTLDNQQIQIATDRLSHFWNITLNNNLQGRTYFYEPFSYENGPATYNGNLTGLTLVYSDTYYHTPAEVAAELKNINIDTNTLLKISSMVSYCQQTEAEVISTLGKKYVFPITRLGSPLSFSIIKRICIKLSAGRVDGILHGNGININNIDKDVLTGLLTGAKSDMDKILSEDLLLPDAVRLYAIESATTSNNLDPLTRKFQASNTPWW